MRKAEETALDEFQKEGAEADELEELARQEGVVTMETGSEGNKICIRLEDFSQEFGKLTYLGKERKTSENETEKAGKLRTSLTVDRKSHSSLETVNTKFEVPLNSIFN